MAFPFLSEAGFEDGTKGHFDTETDTETRLDFPHYSDLARYPGAGAPFRGAYCMRVSLLNDGTPADAYVQETGSWDLAADGVLYLRLMFRLRADTVMANTDEFAIVQLWSGASTVEAGAYINYTTAAGFRVGIGEGSATSFAPIQLGKWHCLELRFEIDSGVPNDGTIDAWLDGGALTQVTGLDQAVITSGVVGVLSQDAGTTRGEILFDDIVADDARIFMPAERYPQQVLLTQSGHLFVGAGEIETLDLLSGAATDNVLQVYDTDRAYTSDASAVVLELKNLANNEPVQGDHPIRLHRGAYISLAGTNPRALARIKWANSYSEGAVRQQGLARTVNVGA
jgi:hypothetical protein